MESFWRRFSITNKDNQVSKALIPINENKVFVTYWIVVVEFIVIVAVILGNLLDFLSAKDKLSISMSLKPEVTTNKMQLKLENIQDAHNRIKNSIILTPLIKAKHAGKALCNLYLKCENFQNTGSFKARGASNVLSLMSSQEKSRGCTVSGGRNFILAMTQYGFDQSVPINVVVPKDCPIHEKHQYKENYAIIKTHGNDTNESNLHALTISEQNGSTYIHGSDRLDLMAGYGTLGLELLNQLDKLDAIICPVGTGSLLASLIIAVKSLKPSCLIYGVESSATPTMTRALHEDQPVVVPLNNTFAESLNCTVAVNNAFHIVKRYLNRMITVDECWIARAMMHIYEREKMVVEGAAACTVAVIIADKVPELRGKNVVSILSGGNIHCMRFSQVMERGMAAEGRLVRFSTALPDAPGAMARLLTKVTENGADVRTFVPERSWMRPEVFSLCVHMLIETCDMAHAKDLETKLLKYYPRSHYSLM